MAPHFFVISSEARDLQLSDSQTADSSRQEQPLGMTISLEHEIQTPRSHTTRVVDGRDARRSTDEFRRLRSGQALAQPNRTKLGCGTHFVQERNSRDSTLTPHS